MLMQAVYFKGGEFIHCKLYFLSEQKEKKEMTDQNKLIMFNYHKTHIIPNTHDRK